MFELAGSEWIKQSAMIGFGGQEIWVVLMIVLLLFGGAKIPQMMRGLGEGMREFKKASRDDEDEEPASKPSRSAPSDNERP